MIAGVFNAGRFATVSKCHRDLGLAEKNKREETMRSRK